jgi:phage anti-repressor protein
MCLHITKEIVMIDRNQLSRMTRRRLEELEGHVKQMLNDAERTVDPELQELVLQDALKAEREINVILDRR